MSGSVMTGVGGCSWVGGVRDAAPHPTVPRMAPTEEDVAPVLAVLRGRPRVHYLETTLSPIPAHTGHLGLKQVWLHMALSLEIQMPWP